MITPPRTATLTRSARRGGDYRPGSYLSDASIHVVALADQSRDLGKSWIAGPAGWLLTLEG